MDLRQCIEHNAYSYSIKLLGCVMRGVLMSPWDVRCLTIMSSADMLGPQGQTVAELLPSRSSERGTLSHMPYGLKLIHPTNEA